MTDVSIGATDSNECVLLLMVLPRGEGKCMWFVVCACGTICDQWEERRGPNERCTLRLRRYGACAWCVPFSYTAVTPKQLFLILHGALNFFACLLGCTYVWMDGWTLQVAVHRHGCCVLQRCLDAAGANLRIKLIDEVTTNNRPMSRSTLQ